jgi:hypothetical protein
MKYRNSGHNRLLDRYVYNWDLNEFETAFFRGEVEFREMAE